VKRLIEILGFVFIMTIMISGCAINRQAVRNKIIDRVDPISITDETEFLKAVDECADYARNELYRIRDEQLGNALIGGLIGAGVGYGISKIYGVGNRYTSANTAIGAIGGAVGGAMTVRGQYNALIYNCMTNRGFKMLY